MRKLSLLILAAILLSACDYIPKLTKKSEDSFVDTVYNVTPVDTLQLTLEALKNKPIIRGYQQKNELNVDTLYYAGFSISEYDLEQYHFVNENNEKFVFDRNDTKWKLIKKSDYPTTVNKGLVPNPELLASKLLIVWRELVLLKEAHNQEAYIDENLKEIVFIKLAITENVAENEESDNPNEAKK